ncbi:unnamed protein product [Amoebophrya sp. A120]|nr:unnamed protein product [Amoebophrya sp. A120]|eukprot:GSA120T00001060001.1
MASSSTSSSSSSMPPATDTSESSSSSTVGVPAARPEQRTTGSTAPLHHPNSSPENELLVDESKLISKTPAPGLTVGLVTACLVLVVGAAYVSVFGIEFHQPGAPVPITDQADGAGLPVRGAAGDPARSSSSSTAARPATAAAAAAAAAASAKSYAETSRSLALGFSSNSFSSPPNSNTAASTSPSAETKVAKILGPDSQNSFLASEQRTGHPKGTTAGEQPQVQNKSASSTPFSLSESSSTTTLPPDSLELQQQRSTANGALLVRPNAPPRNGADGLYDEAATTTPRTTSTPVASPPDGAVPTSSFRQLLDLPGVVSRKIRDKLMGWTQEVEHDSEEDMRPWEGNVRGGNYIPCRGCKRYRPELQRPLTRSSPALMYTTNVEDKNAGSSSTSQRSSLQFFENDESYDDDFASATDGFDTARSRTTGSKRSSESDAGRTATRTSNTGPPDVEGFFTPMSEFKGIKGGTGTNERSGRATGEDTTRSAASSRGDPSTVAPSPAWSTGTTPGGGGQTPGWPARDVQAAMPVSGSTGKPDIVASPPAASTQSGGAQLPTTIAAAQLGSAAVFVPQPRPGASAAPSQPGQPGSLQQQQGSLPGVVSSQATNANAAAQGGTQGNPMFTVVPGQNGGPPRMIPIQQQQQSRSQSRHASAGSPVVMSKQPQYMMVNGKLVQVLPAQNPPIQRPSGPQGVVVPQQQQQQQTQPQQLEITQRVQQLPATPAPAGAPPPAAQPKIVNQAQQTQIQSQITNSLLPVSQSPTPSFQSAVSSSAPDVESSLVQPPSGGSAVASVAEQQPGYGSTQADGAEGRTSTSQQPLMLSSGTGEVLPVPSPQMMQRAGTSALPTSSQPAAEQLPGMKPAQLPAQQPIVSAVAPTAPEQAQQPQSAESVVSGALPPNNAPQAQGRHTQPIIADSSAAALAGSSSSSTSSAMKMKNQQLATSGTKLTQSTEQALPIPQLPQASAQLPQPAAVQQQPARPPTVRGLPQQWRDKDANGYPMVKCDAEVAFFSADGFQKVFVDSRSPTAIYDVRYYVPSPMEYAVIDGTEQESTTPDGKYVYKVEAMSEDNSPLKRAKMHDRVTFTKWTAGANGLKKFTLKRVTEVIESGAFMFTVKNPFEIHQEVEGEEFFVGKNHKDVGLKISSVYRVDDAPYMPRIVSLAFSTGGMAEGWDASAAKFLKTLQTLGTSSSA